MLELRPICEHCAAELPPTSGEARICSFECTFCRTCAEDVLAGVCPNCAGNLVERPIRPSGDWREGANLGTFPASTSPHHQPVDLERHRELLAALEGRAPAER